MRGLSRGGLCNRDRRIAFDEGNMTRGRLAFLVLAALLLPLGVPSGTLAASFSITTPYPAVTVQAGNTVSFDLTVTTPTPERVDLALSGVPAGWTGTITGAGNSIDAVYTVGSPPPAVQLSVKVPQDAAASTQTITVTATAAEGTRTLPISITVESASSGGVALTTDFAKLSGTVSSTFTYSLTLENNGTQQQTFTLQGQGPDGWQVEVHPSSNAQALTDTVPGGSSDTLSVTVTPPGTASAGAYPIQVVVRGRLPVGPGAARGRRDGFTGPHAHDPEPGPQRPGHRRRHWHGLADRHEQRLGAAFGRQHDLDAAERLGRDVLSIVDRLAPGGRLPDGDGHDPSPE